MRSLMPFALPLVLGLAACAENPYAGGGEYPVDRCTALEAGTVANGAGETLWEPTTGATDGPQLGRTRDFSLLDHLAYRVRLTHFCGHTVLLVVGDMRDPTSPDKPGPLDWLDALPTWLEGRDPAAPPLTIITTWWSNADGDTPSVGDLRRFRDTVEEVRGDDAWVFNDPNGPAEGTTIITLQDPWRFENAAAATAAMQVVSDVPPDPDPDRRFRREHEVRDRWRHRSPPLFVVLQPLLRITARGADPVEDGIIDALREDPEERR